jgi:CRISPR-associated protein Csm3
MENKKIKNIMKLIETKIVKGTITLETGLHIGGAKSSLDIGGLDTPVVKTPEGLPYIPGSSLKGKIRSLLGIKEGSIDAKNDSMLLKKMFGFEGTKENQNKDAQISRLLFRDSTLDVTQFKEYFNNAILETEYTEAKWENRIDRKSGKAEGGLRQIERVPAGTVFNFEVVVNRYEENGKQDEDLLAKLKEGFKMLENNYLGGSGSRGYGKVKIEYK